MKIKIKDFIYLFLPFILGGIIGYITKDYIDYSILIKPPFAPPNILFPIAWNIIYILMGISYFLLNRNKVNNLERRIYYSQLIVNLLWSIIFFVLKFRFVACLWIILLDILVIWMIILFYKKNKISSFLNFPYLIWILFATYLTIGICILN